MNGGGNDRLGERMNERKYNCQVDYWMGRSSSI